MLAYETRGQGPAVTLLHGFLQDRTSWYELLDRLPGGYRWLLVDLPGHGGSAGVAATIAAAVEGVVATWDHLGAARSHLVGYSMGGRVALQVAAIHAGRLLSLLTLGAHAGLESAERAARAESDTALAGELERDGIDAFAERWAAQPLFAGIARRRPDALARLDAMRRRQDPAAIAGALRGMGAGAALPVWDRLDAVSVPATFAAGAEDERYVQAAHRLAQAVPGARAVTIPDAGHAAHVEQPDAFARLLAQHLAQPGTR